MSNRRAFLKSIPMAAAAGFFAASTTKALAEACGLATPRETSGPFYPGDPNFRAEYDLTRVEGSSVEALGERVFLHGIVQDENCRPVKNANVEIWQACASGKYLHARDPNPAEADPNFRYWSEAFTGADGKFAFKTIKPGAYPADVNWDRPPHIHFRISALGFNELVTQMYFKGEELNEKDLILRQHPAHERELLVVDFQPVPTGGIRGNFVITLKKVRGA
jgi:protocatechuate 3,4-dioxygenase beta subunit